ncbi:MAG: hypothetical protein ACK5PF_03625 [bacterium]
MNPCKPWETTLGPTIGPALRRLLGRL